MILTITYTGHNTADLGYLLYKNPYRPQAFELSYGKAYVFYPEISNERTTAALLLDIDPIDLARGSRGPSGGGLFDYVNDRPYVSSSFMSTAISKVFGTAMTGRADAHQGLSDSALDLTATLAMLPCRGEQKKLNDVFEPLGYSVSYETFVSDEKFFGWGESKYVNLTISGKVRLRDLLKHLYVLIPVFDRQKHYWMGTDEVEKLLRIGEGWLPNHPEKGYITGRYFNKRRSLTNMAAKLLAETDTESDNETAEENPPEKEKPDKRPRLNEQRLNVVVAELKKRGARRIIDVGCGEGNLLELLIGESQFTNIAGMDVSTAALRRAGEKLKLHRSGSMRERITLFQGSLTYRDSRLSGYDAACVLEVLEHLDISRLAAFERALFEFARVPLVIITTPNREYNTNFEGLSENGLRHPDHRFEWTRAEFANWAKKTAEKFGYRPLVSEIGITDRIDVIDGKCGAPTQMGVFELL